MLTQLSRKLALNVRKKALSSFIDAPIVSFTFDDFPESAVTHGAKLLEKSGATGTYYLAPNLLGRTENNIQMCSLEHLVYLQKNGHELGAHTYNHVDCQKLSHDDFLSEIKQTKSFFEKKMGISPSSFAYPFGHLDLRSKQLAKESYSTARSVARGLNYKTIDLAALRAVPIYSRNFDLSYFQKILDEAKKKCAWVIFYTHDIDEVPSPYGATPEQLEMIINMTSVNNIQILNVKNALGKIAFTQY